MMLLVLVARMNENVFAFPDSGQLLPLSCIVVGVP